MSTAAGSTRRSKPGLRLLPSAGPKSPVAPSEAFAADLQHWVGPRHAHKIVSIHHGFDAAAFHNSRPAPPELAAQLENPRRVLRLLLVSNYTYYRNFETLVRAMPLIQERLRPRQVELRPTCKFGDAPNPDPIARTALPCSATN